MMGSVGEKLREYPGESKKLPRKNEYFVNVDLGNLRTVCS